ncbi:DUF397 domain-containing protein [Streptomyces laurentii]|uniref:DUF397 domain-containing protein n=1 Tax=Streptomyces laurentii TaxID=39478 RepID=UPI0036B136F0
MSHEQMDLVWFKSSYSQGNGGSCVEVADACTAVAVRDSKQVDGPVILLSKASFGTFVVKAGEVR